MKTDRERSAASERHGPQAADRGGGRLAAEAARRLEDWVDETLDASFPASDPPGWTLGHGPLAAADQEGRETPADGEAEPR